MQALVTGGTGFVGSHLIESLIDSGHEVRALVRPSSDSSLIRSLGAEVVIGELDDEAALKKACRGIDVVYHAAARVEFTGTEEEFNQITVMGTREVVRAANEAGVGRFVYVSSCGVYHPRLFASGMVIDESTPALEPPRWFIYGRAKHRAERVVIEQSRCEWVIIRLAYVYGPRDRTMRAYLEPVLNDDIMMLVGDGQNELAMIYVTDAALATMLAGIVPEAASQILVAGSDERVTQQQYFDALADGFGVPHVTKKVPYGIAFFFGWLGEMLFRSEPRRTALRRSAIVLTGLPQRIRCEKTQEILNWRPETQFAEGMRKAFEWYHAELGTGKAEAAAPSGRAIGVPHSGQTADSSL